MWRLLLELVHCEEEREGGARIFFKKGIISVGDCHGTSRILSIQRINTYSRTSTPAAGTHRDLKAERHSYQAAERFKLRIYLESVARMPPSGQV